MSNWASLRTMFCPSFAALPNHSTPKGEPTSTLLLNVCPTCAAQEPNSPLLHADPSFHAANLAPHGWPSQAMPLPILPSLHKIQGL